MRSSAWCVVALLLAAASSDALVVQQGVRPALAVRCTRMPAPRAEAVEGVTDEASDAPAAPAAPAAPVDLDDGKFMRWYRAEKMREKYEEENPVDPFERIKRPLFSLLFIGIGFNLGPIIGKVREIADFVIGATSS